MIYNAHHIQTAYTLSRIAENNFEAKTDMIPRVNIISRKASVVHVNGAGKSGVL